MISSPENQQRDPPAEAQVRLDVSPEDSAQLARGEGAEGEEPIRTQHTLWPTNQNTVYIIASQ